METTTVQFTDKTIRHLKDVGIIVLYINDVEFGHFIGDFSSLIENVVRVDKQTETTVAIYCTV